MLPTNTNDVEMSKKDFCRPTRKKVRLKENNNCCISENGYKLAGLHYYKVGAHKILLGETQLSPTTTEVVLIGLAKGTSGS